MLGAVAAIGLLTVLVMTQLAEVAGSLTGYQTNLHQKIQDIRDLSEGGGALSRFIAMIASLANDLAPRRRTGAGGGGARAERRLRVSPASPPSWRRCCIRCCRVGIVIILVVFILLDRDHLSDQFVRLFGASDVHATSEALGDAAARIARVLSLQLLTNFGFALLVGGGLFALGMPNARAVGTAGRRVALRALRRRHRWAPCCRP